VSVSSFFFFDVLGRVFPKQTSIMAKKELRWSPLGPFMSLGRAIFVDRGNSAKAIQSLADAGEAMKKQGTSLWVFPEGTRSSSEKPAMLPFKKGGFHLAVQAGIPIVPVVTQNYWWLYHAGVFNHGLIKVKGKPSFPISHRSTLIPAVLAPIPTAGLTDADVPTLAERVHDDMLTTLLEISPRETELSVSTPPTAEMVPPVTESTDPSERVSESTHPPSMVESESQPPLLMESIYTRKTDGSENGTETEEDEGMVLVGRPGQ
jgi:lysophosphatidate acyltransferase